MKPEDLVGIPYENLGSTFRGVDCWGLVHLCLSACYGTMVPRYADYADANSLQASQAILSKWDSWHPVTLGQEAPGDIVAFLGVQTRRPTHCGIVISSGLFLHSYPGRDTCIENYERGVWRRLLWKISRWKS